MNNQEKNPSPIIKVLETGNWREGDFPVTEDLGRRGLALPFSGVMTEEQVEVVCRSIREASSAA